MARRVVVTDGPQGPSVQIDEFGQGAGGRQQGVSVTALWSGALSLAPAGAPGSDHDVALSPPPGHADFRIVSFAAEDGASEPYWHRTNSIDFGVVLDGEIRLLLEGRHVDLQAGDVVVQFGTPHAWANPFGTTCRMGFLLIGTERGR
jgi:quercetin dioxygenase-like cupin family protein